VPRRNPELVVTVLQEHGDWGSGSALIAAKIVSAYVEKKRRLDHNLVAVKQPDAPVEMGAVWTAPASNGAAKVGAPSAKGNQPAPGPAAADHMQAGHFLVDHGQIVPAKVASPNAAAKAPTTVAKPANPPLPPATSVLPAAKAQPVRPVKGQ